MADKLSIYNMALGHLEEASLRSLSEGAERRRVLDSFWNHVVGLCLEETAWKFAKRVVRIDASTTTTPDFGFAYAFQIPQDWVRTDEVSAQENLKPPLTDVRTEAGFWFANVTPLFVSYVSNDPQYGLNVGAWPVTFVEWFALELACKGCKRITGADSLLDGPSGLLRQARSAKRKAKGNDAQNDPIRFPPVGTWASSRRGNNPPSSQDGGSNSSLIG